MPGAELRSLYISIAAAALVAAGRCRTAGDVLGGELAEAGGRR